MSLRLVRPLLGAALAVLVGGCGSQDGPLAPAAPAAPPRPAASLLGPLFQPILQLPKLLLCPSESEQTASAVIGPDGGELAIGRFRVAFPAGAVAQPERFVLTVVRGALLEIEVHADGHEHYEFAAPVEVTLDLARCVLPPPHVQAWNIDPQTKTLLENMGGRYDLLGRTLRFSTTHFSGYSVAW